MELRIITRSINLNLKAWYLLSQSHFSSSVERPVHYLSPYSEPVQSGPHNHALFIFHLIQTPTSVQVVQHYEATRCMLNTFAFVIII